MIKLKPPSWFTRPHLSPSSINKWIASPHAWAACYVGEISDPPGAAAIRGQVVEELFVSVLMEEREPLDALYRAEREVLERCRQTSQGGLFSGGRMLPGAEQEASRAKAILKHCLDHVAGSAKPSFPHEGQQWRVEADLGVGIPVIGYIDLLWPRERTLLDLKTSARKPGKMKAAHLRQLALYRHRGAGYKCGFAIAHPEGFEVFYPDHDDLDLAFHDLTDAARRLVRWLNRYESAKDLLEECMPDADGIHFPSRGMEQIRRTFGLPVDANELWGE